ncbi:hypothetical protein [Geopseudomonas aromaticivorans]
MTWTFPVSQYTADLERKDMPANLFVVPAKAVPITLMNAGGTTAYLAVRKEAEFEYSYWACPRYGETVRLDADRVERDLIAGVMTGLPARPNAITFLNRIVKLPEHLADRIISHVENSNIRTIYLDNLDLGKALRSCYRTMGHAVQREVEISRMANALAKTKDRAELLRNYRNSHPEEWIATAMQRMTRIPTRPGERVVDTSHLGNIDFGFG